MGLCMSVIPLTIVYRSLPDLIFVYVTYIVVYLVHAIYVAMVTAGLYIYGRVTLQYHHGNSGS